MARQGFRHLLRRLGRSPMFTMVAILTIAIGVGANSAIFSVVNGVLLKPLPYPDPDRLVALRQTAPKINIKEVDLSVPDYFILSEQNRSFSSLGIWNSGTVTVTGKDAPEQVRITSVTEGVFPTLGVAPFAGRVFTAADTAPGSPQTVVVTHAYWQKRFGGDPSAVGSRMIVDGQATEIIGILPAAFRFLDETREFFQPLRFNRARVQLGNYNYRGIARLRPGVTLSEANTDAARLTSITLASFPAPPGWSAKMFGDAEIQPALRLLHRDIVGDLATVLWLLMGSIGFVLLIACANVANLLLVRAEARQHEIAVRLALGASGRQIGGELLSESLMLGVLGGAAGLGFAWIATRLLVSSAPAYLPRIDNIGIGWPVILFTLAISLAAGLLFGAIPVLKYAAPNVTAALRAGGRTLSQGRERHRSRNLLVVVQTALAVVLLVGSGLMIRTFQSLRRVDPGFRAHGLQTFRLFVPQATVKEPERVIRSFQEIQRKLSEIPGVAMAAFANAIPTDGNNSTDGLYAEDRTYREGQMPPLRRFKFVAPGFFETMGVRLIAGRDFTWTDLYDRRLVTVISENLAREMWREPAAALGNRIREGMKGPWREVVGVVADIRHDGSDQKAPTTVYWPILMNNFWGNDTFVQRGVVFVMRSDRAGFDGLMNQVRQTVSSIHAGVPLSRTRTMDEVYAQSMARTTFALLMIAIAGGMALLLGMIGIYGVISYSVSQRTREMGIRIALGAQHRALKSMVVRHGVLLASVGAALGLAAAAALTRLMSALLYQVSPLDPATYATVSAGLIAVAAAASYLPARRAATVDPLEALRAE